MEQILSTESQMNVSNEGEQSPIPDRLRTLAVVLYVKTQAGPYVITSRRRQKWRRDWEYFTAKMF